LQYHLYFAFSRFNPFPRFYFFGFSFKPDSLPFFLTFALNKFANII